MTAACATLAGVTDVDASTPVPGQSPAPAITAEDLVRLTGGRLLVRSERPIRGAAVDSRLVQPGELFVALPGERTDGHAFAGQAIAAGAAALIVTRPIGDADALGDVTVVRVADPLAALWAVATGWRRRFEPLVVGVTGSIAKTSTKEAVASVLATRFRTLRNEGNLNNEIGLPLTLMRLGPEHEAAVLEMGMYVGGEIADLARMAQPRIGVITAVQPVHLARIGSLEAIEAAKGELLEALPPDGRAILNADDPIVRRMGHRSAARSLTYGFAADADVGADAVASAGLEGMRFILRAEGARRPVSIPTLGRLSVHNALAAAAVGLVAGLSLDEIATGLETGWSAAHRVQLVPLGGVTLVDDTYNASPRSVVAALDLLAGLPGRRGAVLGEMLELGEAADEGHRAVGEAAARTVDWLLVVGDGAAGIAEGAQAAGLAPARIVRVRDVESALEAIPPRLRDGDVVLVKASRGIGLERLVEGLQDAVARAARPVSTVELIQGLLLAFALMVILMSPYIRLLHALGFGKRIRSDGPESHFTKEGTPTMGGVLIVLVVIGIYFFLRSGPDASTFAPLAALAGVGLLGAFDDYLNAKTGEGIRVRQKLIWLTVVAFVAAWQIQQTYDITAIPVPFVGKVSIDPWVYVAFGTFAIVAAANGVNITDGLDGLSGGTVAIAFVAYMLIALLNAPLAQPNLALLCVLIIGALLGFLWFNVHPAQIFIGDSGALSLGATLAVTALITGQILVLPLIGIIFVIETMSVILQVAYFRLSGGQRLFRMSPIHHHFELGGWDEEKITIRFWIVAILAALLGVTLFLASVDRLR